MEKITMHEVSAAEEIKALEGCTITSVFGNEDNEKEEWIGLDCKDKDGNVVSLVVSEDGTLHFYDSREKCITSDQLGELAMLAGCSDIDSVNFNNLDPLIEIIIKPIGPNAADRVLTILKEMFSGGLEINECKWNFERELHPMYQCSDPEGNLMISVAVMPKSIKGICGV